MIDVRGCGPNTARAELFLGGAAPGHGRSLQRVAQVVIAAAGGGATETIEGNDATDEKPKSNC